MVGEWVPGSGDTRAQSSVIGVALLVGITMLALGTMAAAVGGVVDDAATDADVRRVTADFERSFRPVETTGRHTSRIQFGSGALTTEPRTVRLLNESGVVETHQANAVVYTPRDATSDGADARRVTYLAGAILVTQGDYTSVVRSPPVASGPGVLVVGLPVLDGSASIGGSRLSVHVDTHVTHSRRSLGTETWRIAVETTTPDAWNRTMTRVGGTPVTTRDFDGDGLPSVVTRFPNDRRAHLVIHDMTLEVRQ